MVDVLKTTLSTIAPLRQFFLLENNIQFILDKCHRYGWADSYVFVVGGVEVGYGCLWGREKRDAIFEFYVLQDYRHLSEQFFVTLSRASGASSIEAQTNDRFLYPMFKIYADDVKTEAILFADERQTDFKLANTNIAARAQQNPDDCQYLLTHNGEEIGEGGFMLNYNLPYADVYYAVNEQHRGKGFGTFFVQELKKEIYKMGRVPAARCNANNVVSKATLLKAGLAVCGERIVGRIKDLQIESTKSQ